METVYLESTFISYLVARQFHQLVVAAHQQITRDWWEYRRDSFRCVVSQVVIDEISSGDEAEAEKREAIVAPLAVLPASLEAERLTQAIMDSEAIPAKAVRDAAHIGVATVNDVQYMLTWNCRHLANAQISKRIQRVCEQFGFEMPTICTPEELLEETDHE